MNRLLYVLPLLFVATLSAAPSLSTPGTQALSAFLKAATDRGDVPGVVVAVTNRDALIYNEAFGLASTLTKRPMTPDAIFSMASMTKPITSAAIMILIDEGKLKLDDEVATYLPKYKNRPVLTKFNEADGSMETRPAKRPITIRHLLTHTSGLGYAFASPLVTKITQKTGKADTDLPLLFDPGDSWQYGPSTRVLGDVIEAVTKQKLDAYLQARILGPLGMGDTAYLVPPAKYARVVGINTRGADGKFSERPAPATYTAAVAGDGGLYGTASDYAKFLRMLLNRGRAGSARILSEKSVKAMLDPQTGGVTVHELESAAPALSKNFPTGAGKDKWGLGFQLAAEQLPNRRSPGSGTWAGIFNTHFFIDPKKDIGVIVMMQTLPFYDDQSMAVYAGAEERIYRNLK